MPRWIAALIGLMMMALAAGAAPILGNAAPEFRLQGQDGKWHELKDYGGKWLVLFFYTKDHMPSDRNEILEFADRLAVFHEVGAAVLGISVDDTASHRKFADELKLGFALLSDPTHDTARQYGVLKKFVGVMEAAQRDTYLIDPQGKIRKHYVEVEPKGHAQKVLDDLQQLKKN